MQATLANQGVEYNLIAQEVESTVQGRTSSSTYTTEAGIRGVVVHMWKGPKVCTDGALIHKVVVRRCRYQGCTEVMYQQVLMHA